MELITQIKLPTKQDLQPLVDEALQTASTPEEFVNKHLNGIMQMLDKNPHMYRHYGPYWWSIKSLLIEHELMTGGEDESTTKAHFNFDEPEYVIGAAWSYMTHQLEQLKITSNVHLFDLDGELYEYSLEDLDMESLIVNA